MRSQNSPRSTDVANLPRSNKRVRISPSASYESVAVSMSGAEKRGAEDSLRDVRKQWRRNHPERAQLPDAQLPVFPTIASRFNDPGVNRLFAALCAALLVISTVIVYAALLAFLRFGRWGVRMRAAGQNPLLAAQRAQTSARDPG